MEQYTLNTPNGLGNFIPVVSSPMEEVIIKEHAKFSAEFQLKNSVQPEEGKDFRILPPLPRIQPAIYLRAVRDLLNMDFETGNKDVPGRVAALYVAMAKVFDIADGIDDPAMREIAGICAAAFGQVQHGEPWKRKSALETMLEQSMAREIDTGQRAAQAAGGAR